MKDLPRKRGRRYITELVAQGEHDMQDFKFAVSDARKIARSVSAFANAGGGRLLIGVKDNGVVAGVRSEEDVYVVEQAASRYCKPAVEVEFTVYSYDTRVDVIQATVPRASRRPVRCQEPDGAWRAYYRVADENIAAHPLMVRAWEASSASFSLSDDAVRLIGLLDASPQGLDIDDIARRLAMSRLRAESLVVDLAAADIAAFVYRAPHFKITRKKD